MAALRCLICEQRPRFENSPYCQQCGGKLDAERRSRTPERASKYLVYQGVVAGLYRIGKDGEGNGVYSVRFLKREAADLPKSITVDLDHYCEGLSRDQVKKYKAIVASVGAKCQPRPCRS